jgi:hypothetical protein
MSSKHEHDKNKGKSDFDDKQRPEQEMSGQTHVHEFLASTK